MKKNILFTISNLGTGGVNSSLSSLYNNMSSLYDIYVLPMTYDGENPFSFNKNLMPKNKLLDAYHCDFSKSKKSEWTFKFIIKLLKKISILLGMNMEKRISLKTIKKIERNWNFDKIVAFQEGVATNFTINFSNPNKIAWIHCDFVDFYPHSKAQEYKYYNKIIFVSNYTRTRFINKYSHYSNRSIYIYNYLNEEDIIKLSNSMVSEEDIFKSDEFKIISIGRIVELKRFSKIPYIASALKKEGINFKWFIIGPPTDKNETDKLLRNINKYNLEDFVYWLNEKKNPYPYLKKSDLYVSLSTTEACPMVFNEARVLNIPIVSTNFGSSYEFISDKDDGYIASIDDMSKCLIEIITNSHIYHKLKKNSGNKYIDNITISKEINKLLNS